MGKEGMARERLRAYHSDFRIAPTKQSRHKAIFLIRLNMHQAQYGTSHDAVFDAILLKVYLCAIWPERTWDGFRFLPVH